MHYFQKNLISGHFGALMLIIYTDQTLWSSQVRLMTELTSALFHLSGIYQAANEHFVFKSNDWSKFDTGQRVVSRWAGQKNHQIFTSSGIFQVCSGSFLSTTVQERNGSEPVRGKVKVKALYVFNFGPLCSVAKENCSGAVWGAWRLWGFDLASKCHTFQSGEASGDVNIKQRAKNLKIWAGIDIRPSTYRMAKTPPLLFLKRTHKRQQGVHRDRLLKLFGRHQYQYQHIVHR